MQLKSGILLAIAALAVYSLFNFVYLPAGTTFPDESRFIDEAVVLHQQGEFRTGDARAWEMPLTAVVYSQLYAITGSENGLIVAARLLQSMLLIAQSFLLAQIAWLLFDNRRAATLALMIGLFYPFFIYYQGVLLSETLFNFLLTAAFWGLYRWWKSARIRWPLFALASVLFAAAVYTKGVLSILPPFLLLFGAWLAPLTRRQRWLYSIAALVLYGLLMSPWWLRNHALLDAFVPFTTSSGWMLHLGNNPMNTSGGGIGGVDASNIPACDALPELAWQRCYIQSALAHMRANPEQTLRLGLVKLARFWRLYPYAPEYSASLYKWVSLLSFGPVLLFAVLTAVIEWRRWRPLLPVYALIAFFSLVHMVFVGSIRYRLPLEPMLIVFASQSLSRLYLRVSYRMRS